jgi:hypothetical protein
MMKAGLGLLIPLVMLGGAALAQPATAPPPEAPPAAAAPAAAAPAPATPAPSGKSGPKVVEGLTVMGHGPLSKACGERDKDCIAMVVAELRAKYPKELKTWCHQEEVRAAWSNLEADSLYADPYHSPIGGSVAVKPIIKTACQPPKK